MFCNKQLSSRYILKKHVARYHVKDEPLDGAQQKSDENMTLNTENKIKMSIDGRQSNKNLKHLSFNNHNSLINIRKKINSNIQGLKKISFDLKKQLNE